MSKIINGIPEKFTLDEYLSVFRSCGVEPEHVKEMRLAPDGAHLVVFAQDENGARILSGEGYEKHDIFIPVER